MSSEYQSWDYKAHQAGNHSWILVTSPSSEKHLVLPYIHALKPVEFKY